MDADDFARKAVDAILAGDRYRTIPWPMGVISAALKIMPRSLFDRLTRRRKQKPRAAA